MRKSLILIITFCAFTADAGWLKNLYQRAGYIGCTRQLVVDTTLKSTSTSTGAVIVQGGISVDSASWFGSTLTVVDSVNAAAVKSTRLYYGISKGDSSYSYKDTSKIVKTDSINVTTQGIFGGKITFDGRFGQIGNHDDTVTTTVIAGAGYTKITGLSSIGNFSGVVCDTANDRLVVPDTGYYFVTYSFSGYPTGANVVWKTAAFVNDDEQDFIHDENKLANANDIGIVGIGSGIVHVAAANATISIRARHDNVGNQNINVTYVSLESHYIGNKQ